MFGEPADIDGECNARLFIADNYGDNSASIRCQLALHHEGLHREQFERKGGLVTITWVADERERCDHGCGQWEHEHRSETIECPSRADDHEYSDCSFCHPEKQPQVCAACGKTYFYEEGHKRHCPSQPFACAACGQSGVGPHACPKEAAAFIAAGGDDEFAEG